MQIKLVKQRFLKENMDIDVQLENFDEDTRLVKDTAMVKDSYQNASIVLIWIPE